MRKPTEQEQIDYFKGVKAQHEGLKASGMIKPNADAIIRTYDFVILTLERWRTKGWNEE